MPNNRKDSLILGAFSIFDDWDIMADATKEKVAPKTPSPTPEPGADAQASPDKTEQEKGTQSSKEKEALQYWGYLFQDNKCGTDLLNRLLLGIANYISANIEPSNTLDLTPTQLAAFYRAVGGNYDGLFLQCDPVSLSYIYTSIGALHSLQPKPTDDGYVAPSIPALKSKGYVTWQTIQLLLDPQEHVPYLQQALRLWDVVIPGEGNGENGEQRIFPKVLPKEAFPVEPDADMVAWFNSVSEKLEREDQARQEEQGRRQTPPSAGSDARTGARDKSSPADGTADDFERHAAAEYFQKTVYEDASGRPIRRFTKNPSYASSASHRSHEKEKERDRDREKDKDRRKSFVSLPKGVRHFFKSSRDEGTGSSSGRNRSRSTPERHSSSSYRQSTVRDENEDAVEEHLHPRWTPTTSTESRSERPRTGERKTSSQERRSTAYSHQDWQTVEKPVRAQRPQYTHRSDSSRHQHEHEGMYANYTHMQPDPSAQHQPVRPHVSNRHSSGEHRRKSYSPVSITDSDDSDFEEVIVHDKTHGGAGGQPEMRERRSYESPASRAYFAGKTQPYSSSYGQERRYSASFPPHSQNYQNQSQQGHTQSQAQPQTYVHPQPQVYTQPFLPSQQPVQPTRPSQPQPTQSYRQTEPNHPPEPPHAAAYAIPTTRIYTTAAPPPPPPPAPETDSSESPTSPPPPGGPGGFVPSKGPLFATLAAQSRGTPSPSPRPEFAYPVAAPSPMPTPSQAAPGAYFDEKDRHRRSFSHVPAPPRDGYGTPEPSAQRAKSVRYVSNPSGRGQGDGNGEGGGRRPTWEEECRRYEEERRRERKRAGHGAGAHRYVRAGELGRS